MPRTWRCRKCKHDNPRTASRRCGGCGEETKPKPRLTPRQRTKAAMDYDAFARLSQLIHGGELGACGMCRRMPREGEDRFHRETDAKTGAPQGIACARCNKETLRQNSLEALRQAVAYRERVLRYQTEAGAENDAATLR